MSAISDRLLGHVDVPAEQRADNVGRALDALTERERRLVTEAALMGYLRGVVAGQAGDVELPGDTAILAEVVDACLALEHLYPTITGYAVPEKRP